MIVIDATPIWTEMVNEYVKKGIMPEFVSMPNPQPVKQITDGKKKR